MLVHQILNSKGDQGVVTIKPGTPVSEAASILADKRIGAVVVSATGQSVEGILSERDIVRELGALGAACLSNVIDDYMTTELVTCVMGDDATKVMEKMIEGRFRHMPVMDGDVMVGLITLGDTVKARLSELKMEKDALEGMIMGH